MPKEKGKEKIKEYKIKIDNEPYTWEDKFITGRQIKELAQVNMAYSVWLKVKGPGKDVRIGDDEKVDLSEKGREKFFTGPTDTTEGQHGIFAR